MLTDPDLRAPFEMDWTRRFSGTAGLVVRPAVAPSLEAAEVFFAAGLELVRRHAGGVAPFAVEHPAYLLLECAAHRDPTEELADALAEADEVLDVAVATDAP